MAAPGFKPGQVFARLDIRLLPGVACRSYADIAFTTVVGSIVVYCYVLLRIGDVRNPVKPTLISGYDSQGMVRSERNSLGGIGGS